jgi:hypothetical protein
LRKDIMANEYLQRTPTSTGNARVWTWSGWLKLNDTAAAPTNIFMARTIAGGADFTYIDSNAGEIRFADDAGYTNNTARKIRDSSGWFHLLCNLNTTSSSGDDRMNIYINGVLETNLSSTSNPVINYQATVNTIILHTIGNNSNGQYGEYNIADVFLVDGQALTPDVFGFYKQGNGYISAGSTQATDFRPGQWVLKTPRVIKTEINRRGGFGVNGFYLPMNDSSNFGADFHTTPNSIITLKGEDLPQPRNGAPTTTDAYVSQLREDPYAANLVLAIPGISGGQGSGYGDYSADIKGSGNNKTVTANGNAGVAVTASYYGSALSFDGSGDYLTTNTSTDFQLGSDDFTVEGWVNYKTGNGADTPLCLDNTTTTYAPLFGYLSGNLGTPQLYLSSTGSSWDIANGVGFGPVVNIGQWTHLAVSRKGTNILLFRDGVGVGIVTNAGSKSIYQASNQVSIGRVQSTQEFDGYIQDLRVYKGVAKYTGGFDVPRPYTPVGIATWRQVPDTTANNFATWNPVSPASDTTFTNGNLTVAYGTNATRGVVTGTVGIAVTGSGKYYWENRIDASSTSPTNAMIGVWGMSTSTSAANYPGFTNTYGWSYYGSSSGSDGFYSATGGANATRNYGATYTTGDIIGVSLDMTTNNGSLEFYKNGVSQGVATTGLGAFLTNGNVHALMPALGDGASTATFTISSNFGQNPTFSGNTTAGTFTDSNGKGLFKYQPPSGFLALCEDNLPTPAISDPGEYFRSVLWTGDGASTKSIVGVGFTPDLVWMKGRTVASDHSLIDSVRGLGATSLSSNQTYADNDFGLKVLSFDKDGFSVATGSFNFSYANTSGSTYAAWCWRAGAGTTSTNTNGSITSVVSVNQDAGFSVVSYTGNANASATVGHGLNKAPSMVIIKNRSEVRSWIVYHRSASPTPNPLNATNFALGSLSSGCLSLNLNNGTFAYTMDGQTNGNGSNHIAYCWAEIEGFSKAFSYTGNGSTDGPFIFTNFRPAWVIIKQTNGTGDWYIFDSSRNSTNPVSLGLLSNTTQIDVNYVGWGDFLSNGFKIRRTDSAWNASGGTYIGMAFAESPFQTANSK